jgi:S-adenosylmethionine:tRNA ribosyltransferase-isomerase
MPLSPYLLSSYAYELDPANVAQVPVFPPESARLLTLNPDGQMGHGDFFGLPGQLADHTAMFLNDTKVLPARIKSAFSITHRGTIRERTGEILYLNLVDLPAGESADRFEAMVYPGDSFPIGAVVTLGGYEFETLEITYQGRIFVMKSRNSAMDMLMDYGIYPIPPYIEPSREAQDQYQTEFARHPGSLAAPTASLHFTRSLLEACETAAHAKLCYATLHVGIGTFKIVNQEDIRNHTMHAETMLVTRNILEAVAQAKLAGNPVLAVGTTMVRYLESLLYIWPLVETQANLSEEAKSWWQRQSDVSIDANHPEFVRDELFRLRSNFHDGVATAETSIFIYPGYEFGVVDEIVTNFHLPNSTLIPMISAFAGLRNLKVAYENAKSEGYRFYSFGDAMRLVKK